MSIRPSATFDTRKAGMSESFRRAGVEFTNGKRPGAEAFALGRVKIATGIATGKTRGFLCRAVRLC
jgi:hypothetical protein